VNVRDVSRLLVDEIRVSGEGLESDSIVPSAPGSMAPSIMLARLEHSSQIKAFLRRCLSTYWDSAASEVRAQESQGLGNVLV